MACMRYVIAILSLAGMVLTGQGVTAGVGDSEKQWLEYKRLELKKEKLNLASVGLKNCGDAVRLSRVRFLVSCRGDDRDQDRDYGMRLYLIGKEDKGTYRILFRSRGAMDSYIYRPHVFANAKASCPKLVLAESAAEYAWGLDLYLVKGDEVRLAGAMGVGVERIDPKHPELSDNPISAVPYTRIRARGKKLEVTFTENLVLMEGGKFESVKKSDLRYEFDGVKLRLIRRDLKTR